VLGLERRAVAVAFGGVPAVVALSILHRLDATDAQILGYALVPLAGAATLVVCLLIGRRVARRVAG
jgi:hypothetical protein